MLENNPPRNSQPETHQDDEAGDGVCAVPGPPDSHRIDRFPRCLKNSPRLPPRSGLLFLRGEVRLNLRRRQVAERGVKPFAVVDFLQKLVDRRFCVRQIPVFAAVVEWRGASQLRALPEPDVNLSIHPAPIIGPLVSSSSVRTGRDCVVLPSATSPMSPWCGLGTVCIYELPIARETHRSCAAPPEASRGKTGHSSAPSL